MTTSPASAGTTSRLPVRDARHDVAAGLTVWAVLVPESLAYATIAGVPPVVGLYAAVPSMVLYALLGSSRHLVVAPMSATAAMSAAIVAAHAAGSGVPVERLAALTAALAVVTGVVALVAGLARLGFLASFVSEPVMRGFVVGLALTILVGQLPALLGVDKHGENTLAQAGHVLTSLGHVRGATAALGLLSLAVVLAVRRWAPGVPGSLLVVVLGILAVPLLGLESHGVEVVGQVPSGLPPLAVPDVSWSDWLALLGPACGVALVGMVEGLGAASTYAARDGYDIDVDAELRGLGAANLGAGFCSGMVVNGSLSKTAVNAGAGARSQVSGLTAAALTVVTLLFLTGLFETLPEATLAAVVIAAVIELVNPTAVRALGRVRSRRLTRLYGRAARADLLGALAALVGVLVFDVLAGLATGVVASLVLLLARASRPHVTPLARVGGAWREAPGVASGRQIDVRDGVGSRALDDVGTPALDDPGAGAPDGGRGGALVLRVEGAVLFVNASALRDCVRAEARRRGCAVVVLALASMPAVDVTGAETLARLAHDLERDGVRLVLAGATGQVRDVFAATEPDLLTRCVADVDAALGTASSREPSPSVEPATSRASSAAAQPASSRASSAAAQPASSPAPASSPEEGEVGADHRS